MTLTEIAEQSLESSGSRVPQGALRDLAAAFSLVNIAYLKIWSQLFEPGVAVDRVFFPAVLLNVTLAGTVCWIVLRAARRRRREFAWWPRVIFTVPLSAALHGILTVLFLNSDKRLARVACYGVAAIVLAAFILSRRFAQQTVAVALVLTPFLAVTVPQAGWRLAFYDPAAHRSGPTLPLLPSASRPAARVVWILFDGWDYGLTYTHRDLGLRLPELDRVRGEGLFAQNAVPAGLYTTASVPKLLTGEPKPDLAAAGAGPNVFSRARDLGFNTAVVGWFFDYCGTFDMQVCDTVSTTLQRSRLGRSFARILWDQTRVLFEFEYRSPFGQFAQTSAHARAFRQWLPMAREAVADERLGLVFLHALVPHQPFFYSRASGRDDVGSTPVVSFLRGLHYPDYIDALELMDHTLGELRRSMETTGAWANSTVILSSDHPFPFRSSVDGRPLEKRIPLIVRFPGQTRPVTYRPPFSAIHTAGLALAVLKREVASAEQAAAWLDRRREQ